MMRTEIFILEEDSRHRLALRRVAEVSGLTSLAFESLAALQAHLRDTGTEADGSKILAFDPSRFPELMSASFVIVALANDGDFDTRAQLMERGAFEVLPKESIETHGRAIFARAARVAALEGQNRELREQALSEFSASWPSSFRADLPLREIERRYIAHVLKSQGGVQESAAKVLGIDRKTLYRRRKEIAAVEGGENG